MSESVIDSLAQDPALTVDPGPHPRFETQVWWASGFWTLWSGYVMAVALSCIRDSEAESQLDKQLPYSEIILT